MKPHETRDNPSIARPVDQCYGEDEIFAALGKLSQEEITRIQSFARFRLMGGAERPGHVEAEDLFIDAAIRTMERERRWTRGVSAFNHFFAVMRSSGHQRRKQASRYMPLNEDVAASQNWSPSALDAQAIVTRLKEQLRGDAIALNILESISDEVSPRCTRQTLGINAKVYWAARKRIRRLAESLPGACHFQRRATATRGRR